MQDSLSGVQENTFYPRVTSMISFSGVPDW